MRFKRLVIISAILLGMGLLLPTLILSGAPIAGISGTYRAGTYGIERGARLLSTDRESAHSSIGVTAPATDWYMAEGATAEGFETYVLIQNPGTETAHANVTFMTAEGEVDGPPVTLVPGSRQTVTIADTVESIQVSTRVTSDRPVIAERAVYCGPPACQSFIVAIDPGHSMNCPSSEIDPATGLDVADNGGASGELRSNWELALKTKEKLEGMGYEVEFTKPSIDAYASLRTRADIGNTCSIMVRLHYDFNLHAILFPAEGQYKQRGGNIVYVNPEVAGSSAVLAQTMFPFLQSVGVTRIMNDVGGTSNNTGPAFVGSVLSEVPVVLIEDNPSMVRDNPTGQDQVASAIAQGVDTFFRSR